MGSREEQGLTKIIKSFNDQKNPHGRMGVGEPPHEMKRKSSWYLHIELNIIQVTTIQKRNGIVSITMGLNVIMEVGVEQSM